jgi:hypothetical protein
MMGGTLGKVHLWLTFVGFHLTFPVQHWLGAEGCPAAYADYLPTDGFTTLDMISSIGALRSRPPRCCSTTPQRYGRVVTVDDPWGFGDSLELGHELPAAAAQLHRAAADPAVTPWPSPVICSWWEEGYRQLGEEVICRWGKSPRKVPINQDDHSRRTAAREGLRDGDRADDVSTNENSSASGFDLARGRKRITVNRARVRWFAARKPTIDTRYLRPTSADGHAEFRPPIVHPCRHESFPPPFRAPPSPLMGRTLSITWVTARWSYRHM